ncbi:hypothetical protein G7Y89_g11826 [Cudoniella acicularis]|uniref:Uncharacterized protein n=1 Tax=Cudoniella acicularis TaxID=354080 RepID=A0A8H4RCR7_9HELO|nr:hypothetical protein G7Y89_g11826 [Cudoniella acicularis]
MARQQNNGLKKREAVPISLYEFWCPFPHRTLKRGGLEDFLVEFWLTSQGLQSLSLEISQNAILRDAFPYRFYIPPFKMPSMSTLRRPLGPITRNNGRGKELTPKMRNKVYALSENSYSVTYNIGRYKLSRGAIRYTLENESSRPESNASMPRPEAPDAYEEGSEGTQIDTREIESYGEFRADDGENC